MGTAAIAAPTMPAFQTDRLDVPGWHFMCTRANCISVRQRALSFPRFFVSQLAGGRKGVLQRREIDLATYKSSNVLWGALLFARPSERSEQREHFVSTVNSAK